jgi:hypothetical protein
LFLAGGHQGPGLLIERALRPSVPVNQRRKVDPIVPNVNIMDFLNRQPGDDEDGNDIGNIPA